MAASEEQELKERKKEKDRLEFEIRERENSNFNNLKNVSSNICPKGSGSKKRLVGVIGPASSTVTIQVLFFSFLSFPFNK